MDILPNISPEIRALLFLLQRVTSSPGRVIEELKPSWGGAVNWDEVYAIARIHSVLPLIHRSLRTYKEGAIPDTFIERIRKEFHKNGLLIQMQKNSLSHVWNTFKATSIPVLFFKGPVLGSMAYGSPIWRKPGDIDILIHPGDYSRAREFLIDAGYTIDQPPAIENNASAHRV